MDSRHPKSLCGGVARRVSESPRQGSCPPRRIHLRRQRRKADQGQAPLRSRQRLLLGHSAAASGPTVGSREPVSSGIEICLFLTFFCLAPWPWFVRLLKRGIG